MKMRRKYKIPKPDKDEGLVEFIKERIKYTKKLHSHHPSVVRSNIIIQLEYLLKKWREVKHD